MIPARPRAWLPLLGVVVLLVSACARVTAPQHASCGGRDSILPLMAQAVPSATYLPCLRTLPPGWTYGGADVRSGSARFWLNSDRAGVHAVEVSLARTCGADPAVDGRYAFPGGCVTYSFGFEGPDASVLSAQVERGLRLLPRSVIVERVRRQTGLALCGAEAPLCPG